ncbi:MAG TPA: hypothetical protein PLK50_09915 [Ottowia sp.]|uniref:hypothetical protein n=1 Tax=Ottowia sp. TaxID=1898956 RepID=UPI002B784314|nr:hypothetical protein [Ottowia sp.]HPZ57624.1 hypothetical protein [Ottowia sp.]
MTLPPAFRLLFIATLVLGANQAGAACYTVHNADGQIVHRAEQAPASAAQALTVPDGGRVTLSPDGCATGVTVAEQVTPSTSSPSTAPLLTHVHIAASARTPYAVVGRDIAVVAPANAEQAWQRAPVADRAAPVSAARRHRPMETVITEWADGRVDVEQRPLPRRY